MQIGDAAKKSGVSSKMIRYYEDIGLIPKVERTPSGYRVYRERELRFLQFIQRARSLGFSIPSIRQLLSLWQDHSRPSADVKAIAQTHIEHLSAKIEALQGVVTTLSDLSDRCEGDDRPECPILDTLAMDDESPEN